MWQQVLFIFSVYLLEYTVGINHEKYPLCANNTQPRSCATQVLGHNNAEYESCKVEYFPSNSAVCKTMNFGPITSNGHIGGVNLRPYILPFTHYDNTSFYSVNYTVLNITFTNIKWKTMKFRFQLTKNVENHCRNIVISNDVTVNDQSVLYYNCYWQVIDGNNNGQSHVLDFEATDDKVVNRGRFFFNIPTAQMLNPLMSEEYWKPFVYLEILTDHMKLHIMPPPKPLKILAYKIDVMREVDKVTQSEEIIKNTTIKVKNNTDEVTYDYNFLGSSGSYYFIITPIHEKCFKNEVECQTVMSPKIPISIEIHPTMNICIASIISVVVALLFLYYIILRVVRKYWCTDYSLPIRNEIPLPPNILVIYSSVNHIHAKCVASFVEYLRFQCGFDVMYDNDISTTTNGDPFEWADDAFRKATHVIYIVDPAEDTHAYESIYEKPIITPHRNVDNLLLSFVKSDKATKCPKDVMNVFFEHSRGPLPVETRHDKVFFLIKDWHKLVAHLSKNLLPKRQIMRTEMGRCFIEDLTKAKKLLGTVREDYIIKCDKSTTNDKKVLL